MDNMATANAEMFINELVAAFEREIMGPEGDVFLAGLGVIGGLIMTALAITAITWVVKLICRWRIFTKAGEKGWKALIPAYNTYTEFAISWSGLQGILMMAALTIGNFLVMTNSSETLIFNIGSWIATYAAVLGLIQTHKLSRSFDHIFGFALGLIFLNPVFMLILAFGKNSQYVESAVKSR